jgi:hypothetical protein
MDFRVSREKVAGLYRPLNVVAAPGEGAQHWPH